ncbi:hypothetical protein IYY11_21270 [Methylocystis sp. H62]|uniref:hypothetical protein n=1 Tax=Methylocystis sp. H62 TaxID=2785789 RepID=UPI0018C3269E|nr:hypothetical protein [Methylocystis sp. H62]MBG0795892.1 hypothetical protein [Methylocystis sp. H62]
MRVVGECTSLSELMKLVAARRYELRIASLALDQAVGVADGYVSKLECGMKRPGEMSLPSILGALGLKLQVIADDDALPASVRALVGTSHYVPPSHRPDEADLAA